MNVQSQDTRFDRKLCNLMYERLNPDGREFQVNMLQTMTVYSRTQFQLGNVSASLSPHEYITYRYHLRSARNTLSEYRILFCDDRRDLLSGYAAPLLTVTNGKAEFVWRDSLEKDALKDNILKITNASSEPSILLMDYYLCNQKKENAFTGCDVINALRAVESDQGESDKGGLIIIGFSSDGMYQHFAEAGANGAVMKHGSDMIDIEEFRGPASILSVQAIAKIIESLNERFKKDGTPPSRAFTSTGCSGGNDLNQNFFIDSKYPVIHSGN